MRYKPAEVHGGTNYCPRRKKHRAKVWVRSESYALGLYRSSDEAELAYETAVALLLVLPKLPTSDKVSPERTKQIQDWLTQLLRNILPEQPNR